MVIWSSSVGVMVRLTQCLTPVNPWRTIFCMKTTDAIRYFGSQSELARALGISRQAVWNWGPEVPPKRQLELVVLTQGKLAPEAFRQVAA